MDIKDIRTVQVFGYDYLGKFENIYTVIPGLELPKRCTYKIPPASVPTGYAAFFNQELDDWEVLKTQIHEPASSEFDHDEATKRYQEGVASGLIPDVERIAREAHELEVSLQSLNEERARRIAAAIDGI